MKTKINKLKPVTVNENVWFYRNEKTLEFIVWSKGTSTDPRQVTSFRIRRALLKKHLE